jgi:hypothetical protein
MLKNEELIESGDAETDEKYILKHKTIILKRAKEVRKNYLEYISRLNIESNSKIGFMDFISSGSCQLGLEKITGYEIYGLYFMRISSDCELKSKLNIHSLFGEGSHYSCQSYVGKSHYFMENILTSSEPTLDSFDEDGNPLYQAENRTEKQIDTLKCIHNAILDYFENVDVRKLNDADKELADEIYSLLSEKNSVMKNDYFSKNEIMYDEFLNREFEVIRPS